MWRGELTDGRQLSVDPGTNRAMVVGPDGAPRPLWDGVHQLRDGSTVTIRSGIMVPNKPVLQLRSSPPAPDALGPEGLASCRTLARKVCGINEACAGSQACSLATQLLGMAQAESRGREPAAYEGGVSAWQQCADALRDEDFFPECQERGLEKSASHCARLAERVCGGRAQCGDTQGCSLARQLLEMENSERLSAASSELPVPTTAQCREAMGDAGLFPPCTRP